MNKRVWCLLLCIAMLISIVPISATADELTFYQVMIDAGNGTQREKAIIEDGEIYIAASSFEKYTRYEYHEDMPGFLVKGQEEDKAFKKVLVNAETKKAAVGTKLIELSNSIVVDGEAYLPFCQMMPILNADIIDVDSGVIYVINNELSMAELLYDFDINEYWFNISEEFFGKTDLLYWYVAPSYLFDTIVNFRFDRLDIVFESGKCEDYQTILTAYLKDDEIFHKAMAEEDFAGDILESITGLTGITGKLADVYDWFEDIEDIDYDPLLSDALVKYIQKTSDSDVFDDELNVWIEAIHGDIVEVGGESFSASDILDGIDYLYTYLNQVEDHQLMLDAVYGIEDHKKKLESIPGASSVFTSVEPEYLAAEQIYELYTGKILPAVTKKAVEETAEKMLEDFAAVKTLGIYSMTAELAGDILELYLPGDSGDRALLPQHADIANSAMRKAAVPTLDTEASTNKYRLSLLLTLIASRACYDIMAETASGYGQDDGYYRRKIDEIENMIMGLYLVAGNVAFDTYENYEAFAEQNIQILMDAGMFEDPMLYPEVDESDYLAFLNDHPEYNYYAFLDINGDGVLELLVAQEVNDDFEPVSNVDIFIYRDNEICLGFSDLWPTYHTLYFDNEKHWIAQYNGGPAGYGMSFYYMDDQLCFQKTSYDARCWRVDENGNEIWEKYYNDVEVTDETIQSYENLASWTSNNSENIVFQALPKAALIGEWNLYPSAIPHENGYWFDVVSSELYLGADGNVSVARGIVQGEYIDGYSGTWTAVPEGDNEFTLQLKLKGGMLYYSDEGTDEQKKCELLLRVKLDGDRLWLEKISGDDICLYYSEEYERDLEYETWVVRQGPVEDHITYKTLLWQYPEHAEYTLYDIDKDDQDELIIREMSSYYVYTMIGGKVKSCGEIYSHYSPYCLYRYDGNGVIVHDGGIGSLHYEYVALHSLSDGLLTEGQNLIDTEWHTLDELHSYLSQYTLIDNFISVVDETLLEAQ